jgi:hypothetical protein
MDERIRACHALPTGGRRCVGRGVAVVQRVRRWFVDQLWERRWEYLDRPDNGPCVLAVVPVDEAVELVGDEGMSTVEYAVGTVVAAALAAV